MGDVERESSLGRDMLAALRGFWTLAAGYQKFLYAVGLILLASAAFHAVVLVASGGALAGDVSWRKPILFGEAFGLTAISIAWFLTFLPRNQRVGWLMAWALGLANLGEVLWVSFQQWRGVPSHFNDNSLFDAVLFDMAGVLIGVAGLVIVSVAVLSWIALQAAPSLAWAIRSGLLLLVAGQVFGGLIIANDGPILGAAGALKAPHALALHAPQALPLLAWLLLFTSWSEALRIRLVLAAAAGYTLAVAVSAFQAFSGRAPFDLELAPAAALGLGVALVGGAYAMALFGLKTRGQAVAPAEGEVQP